MIQLELQQSKNTSKVGDLRKLLGFIGYCQASIHNSSGKAKPLYDLLSTPITTKSKQKIFSKKSKARNHLNWLIGQRNINVF